MRWNNLPNLRKCLWLRSINVSHLQAPALNCNISLPQIKQDHLTQYNWQQLGLLYSFCMFLTFLSIFLATCALLKWQQYDKVLNKMKKSTTLFMDIFIGYPHVNVACKKDYFAIGELETSKILYCVIRTIITCHTWWTVLFQIVYCSQRLLWMLSRF